MDEYLPQIGNEYAEKNKDIEKEEKTLGQNFGILQRLSFQCFLIQNIRSNIDNLENISRYESSLAVLTMILKQYLWGRDPITYEKIYIDKKFELAEKKINFIVGSTFEQLIPDKYERMRMHSSDINRLLEGNQAIVKKKRCDLLWEALTDVMIENGLMFHSGYTYEM